MEWREIADKPADWDEAMGLIKEVIAGQVERLEEMVALHEEIAREEAIELADAASFDPGPVGEELRRYQAAKSRELRQTLELFLQDAGGREAEESHHRGHGGHGGSEGTAGCGRSERSQSRGAGWDGMGRGTGRRGGTV